MRVRIWNPAAERIFGYTVEEALRSAVHEWQTTFDAVTDAVWVLDPEQRIVRSNHRHHEPHDQRV